MSLQLSIITVLYLVHGFQKIIHFRLADTVPPQDPGCHFDMMCECEKHIYCRKDMLGLGGGDIPRNKRKHYSKLKILCNKLTFRSK